MAILSSLVTITIILHCICIDGKFTFNSISYVCKDIFNFVNRYKLNSVVAINYMTKGNNSTWKSLPPSSLGTSPKEFALLG